MLKEIDKKQEKAYLALLFPVSAVVEIYSEFLSSAELWLSEHSLR